MIKVQDVHIPFSGEKDGIWITPFWHEILEYYPTFCEKVREQDETPYPIQPYMLAVAREIDENGYRPEYTRDDLVKRYFQHFGLSHFAKYARKTTDEES
jgi:hypothetical protein